MKNMILYESRQILLAKLHVMQKEKTSTENVCKYWQHFWSVLGIEVFMAVTAVLRVVAPWTLLFTNIVLEEHAAFIFRVNVTRPVNQPTKTRFTGLSQRA
jgi:hypothetical protein